MSDVDKQREEDTFFVSELTSILESYVKEVVALDATVTALANLFKRFDESNKKRGTLNKVYDETFARLLSAARTPFKGMPPTRHFPVVLYLFLKFFDYRGFAKDKDSGNIGKMCNEWHEYFITCAKREDLQAFIAALVQIAINNGAGVGLAPEYFEEALCRYLDTHLCNRATKDPSVIRPKVVHEMQMTWFFYPMLYFLIAATRLSIVPAPKSQEPPIARRILSFTNNMYIKELFHELTLVPSNSIHWLSNMSQQILHSSKERRYHNYFPDISKNVLGLFSNAISASSVTAVLEQLCISEWITLSRLNNAIIEAITELLSRRGPRAGLALSPEALKLWVTALGNFALKLDSLEEQDRANAPSILMEPIAQIALRQSFDFEILADVAGTLFSSHFYKSLLISASVSRIPFKDVAAVMRKLIRAKSIPHDEVIEYVMRQLENHVITPAYGYHSATLNETNTVEVFALFADIVANTEAKSPESHMECLLSNILHPLVALFQLGADKKLLPHEFLSCLLKAPAFLKAVDVQWEKLLEYPQSSLLPFKAINVPKQASCDIVTSEPTIGDFIQTILKRWFSMELRSINLRDLSLSEDHSEVSGTEIYTWCCSSMGSVFLEARSTSTSTLQNVRSCVSLLRMWSTTLGNNRTPLFLAHFAARCCDMITANIGKLPLSGELIQPLTVVPKYMRPEVQALVEYNQRMDEMMSAVRDQYEALTSQLTLNKAKLAEESFTSMSQMVSLLRLSQGTSMSKQDLTTRIEQLERLVTECGKRKTLYDYLTDAANLPPLVDVPNNNDALLEMTIEQLEQLQEHLEQSVGLEPQLYKSLLFFHSQKSALLFTGIRAVDKKIAGTIEGVAEAVRTLVKFLNSIVNDDSITLNNVKSIAATMNQFKHSLDSELNAVYVAKRRSFVDCPVANRNDDHSSQFLSSGKLSAQEIESRRSRLGNAIELVTLAQLWDKAKQFFTSFHIAQYCSLQEFDRILEDPIMRPESVKLAQADYLLQQAHQLMGPSFKTFHFKLLSSLILYREVPLFFIEEGVHILRNRVEVLSSDCQGDQSAMIILDNLMAVMKTLEPIVEYVARLAKKKPVKEPINMFFEAASSAGTLAQTEDSFDRQLKQIDSMAERLTEIKLLISQRGGHSLEALVPYVKKLASVGYFRSKLFGKGELILLRSRDGKSAEAADESESASRVQDAVRSIKVFLDQEGLGKKDPNALETIKNFAEVFQMVERIHTVRLALQEDAHPEFQGTNVRISRPGAPLVEVAHTLADLSNVHFMWTKLLDNALKSHPRLQMLNQSQLAKLLKTIDWLPGSPASELAPSLMPFILNCFPEQAASVFQDPKKPLLDPTQVAMASGRLLAARPDNTESGVQHTLHLAGLWIDQIHELFEQSQPVAEVTTQHPAEIIDATEFYENGLMMFKLLLQLNDIQGDGKGLPLPSQQLWCSETTTEKTLMNFLHRSCTAFSLKYGINFYLLNANLLSLACREALSGWLAEKYKQKSLPMLKVIFSRDIGMDLLNFIKRTKYSVDDLGSDTSVREMATRLRCLGRVVKTVECFTSAPGSGKTRHLRSTLRELKTSGTVEQIIEFAVHENFSAHHLSELMSTPKRIAILFKVSGYAPLADFDSVLQQLTCFGLFWHDSSSLSTRFEQGELHIFVELNPAADEDVAPPSPPVFSSHDAMLRQLPSVMLFAKRITSFGSKFSLDGESAAQIEAATRVAGFLAALRDGSSDAVNGPKSITKINPVDSAAEAAAHLDAHINRVIKAERWSFRQRSLFTRLLADRTEWLLEYATTRTSPDFQQDENLTLLWRALHAEVVELCELQSFGSTVTPMLCRSWNWPQDYDIVAFDSSLTPTWIRHLRSETIVIDVAVARQNPARLRQAFGLALGLSDSSKMYRITSAMQYVLTPELALRLLQLHQFRRAGRPVVMCGRTGTGKTQLLNLYALIINSDSKLIPDILYELPVSIQALTKSAANAAKLAKYNEWCSLLRTEDLGDGQGHFVRPQNLLKFVETVCDAVQGNEAVSHSLYCEIQLFVVRFLTRYSLIKRTPLLQTVFDAGDKPAAELKRVITSPDEVVKVIDELLKAQPAELFYRIELAGHLDHHQICSQLAPAIQRARNVADDDLQVLVFMDEFNTTSQMSLIKEIMCDHSVDGVPLPDNLFVVSAMNPHESVDKSKSSSNEGELRTAFEVSDLVYRVRPIPKSLELLKLDFEDPAESNVQPNSSQHNLKLEMPHIRDFVKIYAKLNNHYFPLENFSDLVYSAHCFVTALAPTELDRDHPSTRDLMRAFRFFHFFTHSTAGRVLINMQFDLQNLRLDTLQPAVPPAAEILRWNDLATFESPDYIDFPAMSVSLMLTYGLRLPKKHRSSFVDFLLPQLRSLGAAATHVGEALLERAKKLYHASSIPMGIAPTAAILENLFAVVVCCEAKVPLVIKGPPGCSKTLSFTIAADNMKGPGSSRPFYQLLHQIQTFRYQCSLSSTDKEIEAVYDAAERRQMLFVDNSTTARTTDRSVVFLDEGGLPSEARNALKVIHYKLDHPIVSSVIMTNKMLDAAKSNRALLVVRDVAADDESELLPLARGIFGISAEDDVQRHGHASYFAGSRQLHLTGLALRSICEAFRTVNTLPEVEHSGLMYQRRDFIHMLRHLHRRSRTGAGASQITGEGLMDSLQRHLNGLRAESFSTVVQHFFSHVNKRLSESSAELKIPRMKSSLELIRESLDERVEAGEHPNVSGFRYILVIDPTSNETAVQLLQSRVIRARAGSRPARICALGDFVGDRNEAAQIEIISQVKNAMAEGDTIILINSEPIQTAFYDVFNRHFSVEYIRVATEASQEDPNMIQSSINFGAINNAEDVVQYTAKLAVGSVSRSCVVHRDFKIIVHLPESGLERALAPFLDRFEKYRVSLEEVFHHDLQRYSFSTAELNSGTSSESRNVFDLVADGALDMIEQLHTSKSVDSLLCAVNSRETVYSLLLEGLKASERTCSDAPLIPPATTLHPIDPPKPVASTSYATSNSAYNQLIHAITTANLHLLQLARPETVYHLRKFIPKSYLREYLLAQEHFYAANFIRHVIAKNFEDEDSARHDQIFGVAKRWMVFTRSSSDIISLSTSASRASLVSLLPANLRESLASSTFVAALSSFSSAAKCDEAVAKASAHTVQFWIVDARECSSKQLSFLSNSISQKASADSVVFVIVHFPAESVITSQQYYSAVFVGGWDYIYIDHLGLESVGDSSAAPAVHLPQRDSSPAIDVQWWLAQACGIDDTKVESEDLAKSSIVASFKQYFLELIDDVCTSKPVVQGHFQSKKYPQSAKAYKSTLSLRDSVKDLLIARPELMEAAIVRFIMRWTKKELHRVLDVITGAIRAGKPVGSFLNSIGSAMQCHLQATVSEVLSKLFSNFLPDTLFSCPEGSWQQQLTLKIISGISPPPVRDPLAHLQARAEVTASRQITELPLFNVVVEHLKQIGETSRQHVARNQTSALAPLRSAFLKAAFRSPLNSAFSLINNTPDALQAFEIDCVRRVFGLSSASGAVLDAACQILTLSVQHRTVEEIFLLSLESPDVLRTINALWLPLLNLTPAVTPNELLQTVQDVLHSQHAPRINEVKNATTTTAITVLWTRLMDIINAAIAEPSDSDDIADAIKIQNAASLDSWLSCAEILLSRVGSKWNLANVVAPVQLARFECIFSIWKYFSSTSQMGGMQALSILWRSRLIAELTAVNPDALLVAGTLFESDPHINALQDIIQELIIPLGGFAEHVSSHQGRQALTTLMRLLVGSVQLPTLYSPLSIAARKSNSWAVNLMFNWMAHSTEDWIDACLQCVRNVLAEIAPTLKPQTLASFCDSILLRIDPADVGGAYKVAQIPAPTSSTSVEDCAVLIEAVVVSYNQLHISRRTDLKRLCTIYKNTHFKADALSVIQSSACASAVLVEIVYELSNGNSKMEEVVGSWPEIAKVTIVDMMRRPDYQLWLLSALPERATLSLLQRKDSTDRTSQLFSVAKWEPVSRVRLFDTSTFAFSAIPESTSPWAREYQQVRKIVLSSKRQEDLVQLLAGWIAAGSELPNTKQHRVLRLRMHLFLICYREFFDQNKSCELLLPLFDPSRAPSALSQLLELKTELILVFNFICSVPPAPSKTNPIQDVFARANMTASTERPPVSITLISCMAASLAIPESANLMYPRMFQPQLLAQHRAAPGSVDSNRDFRDCYYQISDKGELQKSSTMSGFRIYRLSMNCLVWAPLCWHVLLFGNTGAAAISGINHLLNYWTSDGSFSWRQGQDLQRNDADKVAHYLFSRASTFLNELGWDSDRISQISPSFFLTEALFEMTQLFHSDVPPPAAMKALYANVQEVLPCEAQWTAIFCRVLETYANRLQAFQEIQGRSDLSQDLIRRTRAKLSGSLPSLVLNIDIVRRTAIPAAVLVPNPNARGNMVLDPNQPGYIVQLYLDSRKRLAALQRVPVFVSFYQLLFQALAHRITEDQARTFTVPIAISFLEKCFDAQLVRDACDLLRKSWNSFKDAWNAAVDQIQTLRLCPDAQAERSFEGELARVSDEKTTVLSLLTAKTADQLQHGSITRFVKDLLDVQRDILAAAGQESGDKVDLSVFSQGVDLSMILFGFDLPEAIFDAYACCSCSLSPTLLESTLRLDLRRLEAVLRLKAIGKPSDFDCSKLEKAFPFAVAELSTPFLSESPDEAAPSDLGSANYSLLMRMISQERKLTFLPAQRKLTEEEHRRLEVSLKDAHRQNDLTSLGRLFVRLLNEIRDAVDNGDAPTSAKDCSEELAEWITFWLGPNGAPAVIRSLGFSSAIVVDFIRELCMMWFSRGADMFSDVNNLFAIELPQIAANAIATFQSEIIETFANEGSSDVLQSALNCATEVHLFLLDRQQKENILKPNQSTIPLLDFLLKKSALLRDMEADTGLVSRVLPRTVAIRHFVKYAHRLHAFIAFIREYIIATKISGSDNEMVYCEKLPEGLAQIHQRSLQLLEQQQEPASQDIVEGNQSFYFFDVNQVAANAGPTGAAAEEGDPFKDGPVPNPSPATRQEDEMYCILMTIFAIPTVYESLKQYCISVAPMFDGERVLRSAKESSWDNFALSLIESFRGMWHLNIARQRTSLPIRALLFQLDTLIGPVGETRLAQLFIAMDTVAQPYAGASNERMCISAIVRSMQCDALIQNPHGGSASISSCIFPIQKVDKSWNMRTSTPSIMLLNSQDITPERGPSYQQEVSVVFKQLPRVLFVWLPASEAGSQVNSSVPSIVRFNSPEWSRTLSQPFAFRLVSYSETTRHPASFDPVACSAVINVPHSQYSWYHSAGDEVNLDKPAVDLQLVLLIPDPTVSPVEKQIEIKESVIFPIEPKGLAMSGHPAVPMTPALGSSNINLTSSMSSSGIMSNSSLSNSLSFSTSFEWMPVLLKARERNEEDLYEFELQAPTMDALKAALAEEFDVPASKIKKIARVDKVIIRKDDNVKRLTSGTELIVELDK